MKVKCMVCGKVTVNDNDDTKIPWLVSHGICSEECFTKQYPDEDPLDEGQARTGQWVAPVVHGVVR